MVLVRSPLGSLPFLVPLLTSQGLVAIVALIALPSFQGNFCCVAHDS